MRHAGQRGRAAPRSPRSKASARPRRRIRFSRRSSTSRPSQCGFCLSGVILTAKAFLDRNPRATDEQIQQALSGVLCRCFGNVRMLKAIRRYANGRPRMTSTLTPDARARARAGAGFSRRSFLKGSGAVIVDVLRRPASPDRLSAGVRAGHQRDRQHAARFVDRDRRATASSRPTPASASSARDSTPRRCSSSPKSCACRSSACA